MKNLAKAAICGVFHFEFADDEDCDPDLAAKAVEEIFYLLQSCTKPERTALAAALAELKAEEKAGDRRRKPVLRFYETFMKDLNGA